MQAAPSEVTEKLEIPRGMEIQRDKIMMIFLPDNITVLAESEEEQITILAEVKTTLVV